MKNLRQLLIATTLCIVAMGHAAAGNGVDALILDGQTQAGEGRLDDALATLQKAVREYPDSSVAYTRLGGIQVLKQQYRRGIESFQQAVMLDGSNADAFVGMALAYLHLGRYEPARQALREAEKLDASKKTEIARVLAWFDRRSADAAH